MASRRFKAIWTLTVTVAVLSLTCQQASAVEPDATLTLSKSIAFPQAVDIDGDTVVATNGGYSSMPKEAYVFVKPEGGWADMNETVLLVPDATDRADELFGWSAAIDGDTIVLGAPRGWHKHQGVAYVYVKPAGGWQANGPHRPTVILTHTPDYESGAESFGSTVAISGDTIVVGCPGAHGGLGALYVFDKPTGGWTSATGYLEPKAKLMASDQVYYIGLGGGNRIGGVRQSLAIDGDTVVAGGSAQYDPWTGETAASAYVFQRPAAGWTSTYQTARLTYADGVPNRVGHAVAIDGDTVAVGTWNEDTWGAASVFVRPAGGWSDVTEAAVLDRGAGKEFGYALLVEGDTIVVGAPGKTIPASASVFFFDEPDAGWSGVATTDEPPLQDPEGADYSSFGTFLASDGRTLVVGAHWPTYRLYVYGSALNQAPVPAAEFLTRVIIGESVRFDGRGSTDADGSITQYVWDFGDGQSASGEVVQHAYASTGTFSVALTVTDDRGASASIGDLPITVVTVSTAIQDLLDLVSGYDLSKGVGGSLARILTDAKSLAEKGNDTAAADKLTTFIKKVELERGDELTNKQADALVGLANRVLSVL
jgi:PKD repeat protein